MGPDSVPHQEAAPGRAAAGAGGGAAVGSGRETVTGGRATAGARREVVTAGLRARRPGPAPPRPAPVPGGGAQVAVLVRRQVRAGLTAVAPLAVALGLLPVLLAGAGPDVPLAVWLALGAAPYPVLLGAGAWYVRRAERNEGDVTGR